MFNIVFKNLHPSELAKSIVKERVESVLEKYSLLNSHRVTITLEMQNSPTQAGADVFSVSTLIHGKVLKNLKLKKSSENLYLATAHFVEGLNRVLGQKLDRLSKKNKTSSWEYSRLGA